MVGFGLRCSGKALGDKWQVRLFFSSMITPCFHLGAAHSETNTTSRSNNITTPQLPPSILAGRRSAFYEESRVASLPQDEEFMKSSNPCKRVLLFLGAIMHIAVPDMQGGCKLQ